MMPGLAATAIVTTPSGSLLVLALMLPVLAALAAFVVGGKWAERVVQVAVFGGLILAVAIALAVARAGQPLVYIVGGWAPPLGLALRADGISAAMILTTAIVLGAVALYAPSGLRTADGAGEARMPYSFWVLMPSLWAGLNAVFLGGDLFNLYVALELLTFAAVPLVCLDGRRASLNAAMRYLMFALLGSILYLLGAALIYGGYGTLDISLLSVRVRPEPVAYVAAALMTAGLIAKTALFPLHLWLPPAYSNAPPAATAMLSGLVGKASFFLIVRLWFNAMPGLYPNAMAQLLGALGACAIVVGGVVALRQQRLKMLIAYSSVAQIGYLFLLFPLTDAALQPWTGMAWTGGLLQAISHAFAKSAMFLAAGLIVESLGHDRIRDLGGIGRSLPICVLAIGLSGLSLIGVPPSGGFAAKWMMLRAAVGSGQWWWVLVILLGGLLAGGYILRIIRPGLTLTVPAHVPLEAVSRQRQTVVLALALCSILLGLVPLGSFGFLMTGQPVALDGGLK